MIDVRVEQVDTRLEVTESIGPLSAEDVRKIVSKVLERLRDEQERSSHMRDDRTIRNRSYVPDWERHP